jgi:carboxyl-terminal processing protease
MSYYPERRPASGTTCGLAAFSAVAVFLLCLFSFGLGVVLDRTGLLPGSYAQEPAGVAKTFAPFWEAWNLVEKDYVHRQAVQPERMTQGAIEGMLNSLGDEGHTAYLTKDEFQQMEDSIKENLEGIGARMSVRRHQPTIAGVIPGSPAEKAGLKAGDVFMQVNGKDVAEMSLDRIAALVRGPAGTEVDLKIFRPSDSRQIDFKITRAHVKVPDVAWHMLPGVPIAHVALESFGEKAHDQLQEALTDARQQGAKGLIIDVRGNPGGLKDQAVAVTSMFLKSGDVFIEQDAQGIQTKDPVKPGGEWTDIPLCLLIDQGTASSAEIFAGAIQDHERGKLIGMRTFGTGTVLQPYHLSDGSAVLLAVAEWLTPKGRHIWHEGITPDIAVTLPEEASILLPEVAGGLTAEELARSEDKQLLKAVQVMKEQVH